jgi:hypothetical protein
MNLIPGQSVIVLDTTYKPAGAGIVQNYDADTERCMILFQYPGQIQPEVIPMPLARLIPMRTA